MSLFDPFRKKLKTDEKDDSTSGNNNGNPDDKDLKIVLIKDLLVELENPQDAMSFFEDNDCGHIWKMLKDSIEKEAVKTDDQVVFMNNLKSFNDHQNLIERLYENKIINQYLYENYVGHFELVKKDKAIVKAIQVTGEKNILDLAELHKQKIEIRDKKLVTDIEEWFLSAAAGNDILQNYFHRINKKSGIAERIENLINEYGKTISTKTNTANLDLLKNVFKEADKTNTDAIENTFEYSELGILMSKVFNNLKLFSTRDRYEEYQLAILNEVKLDINRSVMKEMMANVFRLIQSVLKSNNQLSFNKNYFEKAEAKYGKSVHNILSEDTELAKGNLFELLVNMAFHYFDLVKYMCKDKSIDYTNLASVQGNTDYILGKIDDDNLKKDFKKFIPNDIDANIIAQYIYDMAKVLGTKRVKGVLVDSNYIGKIKDEQ